MRDTLENGRNLAPEVFFMVKEQIAGGNLQFTFQPATDEISRMDGNEERCANKKGGSSVVYKYETQEGAIVSRLVSKFIYERKTKLSTISRWPGKFSNRI